MRLLVFFHSWAPGCAPLDSLACQYHQGALSMRVSRKGHVVSALEADWLELTAAYYRKGWSLVDSFVYWDTPKGWYDVGSTSGWRRRLREGGRPVCHQHCVARSVDVMTKVSSTDELVSLLI